MTSDKTNMKKLLAMAVGCVRGIIGFWVAHDPSQYRVTIHLVQNLPLTLKQKFSFGLVRPGQARPTRNLRFEVNGRFCTI